MSDTLLRTRIAAGIALLDTLAPGWERHIDLRRLRMENCDTCVLGQLYQSYSYAPILEYSEGGRLRRLTYEGARAYGVEEEWCERAVACAFEHPYNTGNLNTLREWRDVWVEAIKQKRKERKV